MICRHHYDDRLMKRPLNDLFRLVEQDTTRDNLLEVHDENL
jgi:hypothetical protein